MARKQVILEVQTPKGISVRVKRNMMDKKARKSKSRKKKARKRKRMKGRKGGAWDWFNTGRPR